MCSVHGVLYVGNVGAWLTLLRIELSKGFVLGYIGVQEQQFLEVSYSRWMGVWSQEGCGHRYM